MLTTSYKFKNSNGISARAPLIKERNHILFVWSLDGVKCFMLFVIIFCLCSKLKRSDGINKTSIDSFVISSELAVLPEKLCYIWTATRDVKQRKLNYPEKLRYGLNFKLNLKLLHVFLLILLTGDVATNPGPCSSTQNGLKIIYLSAKSLKAFVSSDEGFPCKISKITLLQQLIFGSSYDVVCICETWLNNAVLNGELLPGYNIFRKDRTGKIGGGVLVAIKLELEVLHRPDLERPDCELVVVQIKNQNRKPATLYTFYRPPNSTHNSLNELNDSQSNVEKDCVVVVDDFNLSELKWSEDETTPTNSTGQTGETVYELSNDNFLQQNIMGYTHIGGNKLDLLLSNNPEIIRDVRVLCDEQFPSDHFPIEFFIKQSFKRAYRVRRRIDDFRSGQFEQLRTLRDLQLKW